MAEETKKILEDYLLKILQNEIFIADESYFILDTINEYWEQISIDGYDLFFKSTYSAYFIRYSLAIAKLFDRPSNRKKTISIPFVINFLEEKFSDSSIQQRDNLKRQFSLLGYDLSSISSLSDIELNKKMIEHFKLQLPSTNYSGNLNLSRTLEIIKTYRDKHYTHNEYIEPKNLPKTTFKESLDLLHYAKQFVSIFSLAYLNMLQSPDGKDYFFTEDAKMTSASFKRILEKADLIVRKNIYNK